MLLGLMLFSSCAPTRFVRPLDRGRSAVTAHFGGPLAKFGGAVIPVPMTSLTFGHGFSDKFTGFAGLQTTSLAFRVLHTEIGGTLGLQKPNGWVPGISTSATAHMMIGLKEGAFRFYPEIDANLYWEYGKSETKNYVYSGITNVFELKSLRSYDIEQPHRWLPTLQVGNTFSRSKMDYTLEMKYLNMNVPNQDIVVDYLSPGKKGALGFYFGITRKF